MCMKNEVVSVHPYEKYDDELLKDAEVLIIGSMPPQRFCVSGMELNPTDVQFYYGSSENNFWHIMGTVRGNPFSFENNEEAVRQRIEYLKNQKIGITDIICECIHDDGNSGDNDLKDIKFKEIKKLLANHPSIKKIYFTSIQVQEWFYSLVGVDDKVISIQCNEKTYETIKLPSPSNRGQQNNNAYRKAQEEATEKGTELTYQDWCANKYKELLFKTKTGDEK